MAVMDWTLTHYAVMKLLVQTLRPRSYCEVGVRDGDSLKAVLAVEPRRIDRLALVDNWGPVHGGTNRGSHAHIQALLDDLGYTGLVEWHDEVSETAWPTITDRFDLVLIDADHDEAPTYRDLTEGWARCTTCLVQHDVSMPPVHRALSRFRAEHPEAHYTEFVGDTWTGVLTRRAWA